MWFVKLSESPSLEKTCFVENAPTQADDQALCDLAVNCT